MYGNGAAKNYFPDEELSLPVAPACNMMCNFCSKDMVCVCNRNDPDEIIRCMTPRQAVAMAMAAVHPKSRIKTIKIAGPGEPLFNLQTYEVLRRLNFELPEYIYSVSTNGLMLNEKAMELARLNVKKVEVCINAIFSATALKLYSRIIKDKTVIAGSSELAETLVENQEKGIRRCIQNGMAVQVNTLYFPGINDEDIPAIAAKCKELGVENLCLISCVPGGKLSSLRAPALYELISLQQILVKILPSVQIVNFSPAFDG